MKESSKDAHARGEGEEEAARAGLGPRPEPVVRRTQNGRFANGIVKVVSDQSAEERFTARSHRFRKKLASFLRQSVGESWSTMGEMHRDAANYAGCSMQCAARWIYQFTGPGQEYQVIDLEDEYVLATRGENGR